MDRAQERSSRFHELILQATREYEAVSGALWRSRSVDAKGHKDFFQAVLVDRPLDEGLAHTCESKIGDCTDLSTDPVTIALHPVLGDTRPLDSDCGSEARDSLTALAQAIDEPNSPVFSLYGGVHSPRQDTGQRWDTQSDSVDWRDRVNSESLSKERGGSSRQLDGRTELETRNNSKSQRSSDKSQRSADSAFHFELRSEWLEPPAASGVWGQEVNDSMMRMQAFKQMQLKLGENEEDKGKRKIRTSMVFKSPSARQHGTSRCMVDPSNSYRISWDILGLLFIAYAGHSDGGI